MASISIRKLEKTYGRNKVLKGIDLEIKNGELVSLLGASGSGKTTLLRCLAGLERPDTDSTGEIRVEDQVYSSASRFVAPEKRNVGMVFQSYAVWPHMTVFENVRFPLKLSKDPDSRRKVMEALDLVHLTGLEERYPFQLSGGQQQRVALARALVTRPKVLLLDEPLSNLDAILREELGAEIRRLQKAMDLTTVLVTHDQKEALSLSDRIVLLSQGCIDCIGESEELYSNPPTRFCAEFLAGAQESVDREGKAHFYLPRKWKVEASQGHSGDGDEYRVVNRLFLGNEYEYQAKRQESEHLIKFFSERRIAISEPVRLTYTGKESEKGRPA